MSKQVECSFAQISKELICADHWGGCLHKSVRGGFVQITRVVVCANQ